MIEKPLYTFVESGNKETLKRHERFQTHVKSHMWTNTIWTSEESYSMLPFRTQQDKTCKPQSRYNGRNNNMNKTKEIVNPARAGDRIRLQNTTVPGFSQCSVTNRPIYTSTMKPDRYFKPSPTNTSNIILPLIAICCDVVLNLCLWRSFRVLIL